VALTGRQGDRRVVLAADVDTGHAEVVTRLERGGRAAFDPAGHGLLVPALGSLARALMGTGLNPVLDDFQGDDVEVTPDGRTVVYREDGERIVARPIDGSGRRVVLAEGELFFPRVSPNGGTVLLNESRPEGGRLRVVGIDGNGGRDLCQGYGGAWTPAGTVVFYRSDNDTMRLTEADLYEIDPATGEERRVTESPAVLEVDPAVSPDGSVIAFSDAATGRIGLLPYPAREVAP
jgi:dipeptidyl aminopeptidase/acylaminoacyl peptidase